MKLIVGLGNPGPEYARTRHNLGFMIVDQMANDHEALWRAVSKFQALVAEAALQASPPQPAVRLIFAKPQSFMNNSGPAVQKLMQFYKIDPTDVWVISDDLDTPFGALRIRLTGSAGGHQGLRSIIQHIGPSFVRARVGISLNDRSIEPSESYVLRPFNSDERTILHAVVTQAADILTQNIAMAVPQESTIELLPPQM
jgi:PTH1 family peptidyl-tRNA hydrolase